MDTKKAVEEAEAVCDALRAELAALSSEEVQLKRNLKAVRSRIEEIVPAFDLQEIGLLARAKEEVRLAQLRHTDATSPQFTVPLKQGGSLSIVLCRTTPKRIYVREVGGTYERPLARDGRNVPDDWLLDIAALAAWALEQQK